MNLSRLPRLWAGMGHTIIRHWAWPGGASQQSTRILFSGSRENLRILRYWGCRRVDGVTDEGGPLCIVGTEFRTSSDRWRLATQRLKMTLAVSLYIA